MLWEEVSRAKGLVVIDKEDVLFGQWWAKAWIGQRLQAH